MIKSSIEKVAKDIGFDIGNSDDHVQSDLLNGFCSALSKLNHQDQEMQICYISKLLSYESLEIIPAIGEFCKMEKTEKDNNIK